MSSHALLPVVSWFELCIWPLQLHIKSLTFIALENKIKVRLGRTPYAKDFTYLQDDSTALLVNKTKQNKTK